jgi:hypothetical protein
MIRSAKEGIDTRFLMNICAITSEKILLLVCFNIQGKRSKNIVDGVSTELLGMRLTFSCPLSDLFRWPSVVGCDPLIEEILRGSPVEAGQKVCFPDVSHQVISSA